MLEGEKKKTRLKKMKITSVDMCHRGANQDSYINLKKSERDPPEATEVPNMDEIPQGLWKSIVDAVKDFLGITEPHETPSEEVEKAVDEPVPEEPMKEEDFKKSIRIFNTGILESIESIMGDESLDDIQKSSMIDETLNQFTDACKGLCAKMLNASQEITKATDQPETAHEEMSQPVNPEGDRDMKIDKSRFTPEELSQYESLIAKGLVEEDVEKEEGKIDPAAAKEEMEEDEPEMHPEVKKALEELEEMKKSMAIENLKTVAKKYAPLGKKEDELAATLYDMKKSSEASYNEYIALLDQNLDLVEKSGMFSEIGKSGNYNYTSVAKSEPETKVESIAKSYMEKDPTMSYEMAVAKAWENNPQLMMEYEESAGF